MGKYFSGTMPQVIADALGITVDELQAARNEGKSVAAIAEEKGINIGELTNKMVEARKADLEKLVKDGKITQEQMDAMLENMTAMMKAAIERDTVGGMNDRGDGMGLGQGRGFHNGMMNNQSL